MTLAARAPLALFVLGAASIAYGSIATLPLTTGGQVVATVFLGAGLVMIGALYVAALLAWWPARADELLGDVRAGRRRLARVAPSLFSRATFSEAPVLRWGLCLALLAAAAFAAAVIASDLFAWTRLGWAIPEGAARIVLG